MPPSKRLVSGPKSCAILGQIFFSEAHKGDYGVRGAFLTTKQGSNLLPAFTRFPPLTEYDFSFGQCYWQSLEIAFIPDNGEKFFSLTFECPI
jgi:hypothetical protein